MESSGGFCGAGGIAGGIRWDALVDSWWNSRSSGRFLVVFVALGCF